MPKRITFVSVMDGSSWGGSEALWSGAAIRLRDLGHDVTASIRRWPNPDPAVGRLREAGCRVYERDRNRILSLVLKGFRQDPGLWTATKFIRSTAPGLAVISCGGFGEDLFWCQACQMLRVPYVLIAQAAGEIWWPEDERRNAIRSAYEGAQKVFFVSQGNLSLVQRMLAYRIPNAQVVRNPFNVDYSVICPYPATEPTFNLACVGRLEPYAKGQDLLLEVLNLEKWRRRNLRVSFYGSGASADGMQALSRFYGLDSVVFHGHANDVHEIWKQNHILILPSRLEGLPLVLVEAMLSGRPAVVTDVAGNTEVVHDNETGFVAAAPTVVHLDEAMERAWERRRQWAEMGTEAARRIRLMVPEDPAGVFAHELVALMAAPNAL